jgi:VWFA-related protein
MPTVCQFRGCFVLATALACAAQTPPNSQEITTKDEPATFKTRVNLVMVPVVVRDRQGRAVAGLTKDDFRLLDRGKPQEISRFSVETMALPAPGGTKPAEAPNPENPDEHVAAVAMPDRFIAYLFDDVHLDFADLARARDAAQQHMNMQLRPKDRAAIFSTSGQTVLDFTDDLVKLHDVLFTLRPRPIARSTAQECPDISYYQADWMINKQDQQATQAAIQETVDCMNLQGPAAAAAPGIAQGAARMVLSSGDQETRVALSVMLEVVRRMSAMPGQRILVLASGGFLTLPEHQSQVTDVLDRAIRGNVIVNSLNARGLYTDTAFDASRRTTSLQAQTIKNFLNRQAELAQEGILEEMASGTGGAYFHNNNDLGEGFLRLAAPPEIYYLLGFQPQNLKLDGSFHALKVTLATKSDTTLQARHGYYAPRHLEDAAETTRRELEEALFSREEMRDFSVDLHTQFFKGAGNTATVTVLAHLDLKEIKFRQANGRNVNTLTVVSGLFDRNGNYLKGIEKKIDLNLRPETLQRRLDSGLTVRTTIETEPGTYMVRLVVRDSEGQLMSATNGAIDIP